MMELDLCKLVILTHEGLVSLARGLNTAYSVTEAIDPEQSPVPEAWRKATGMAREAIRDINAAMDRFPLGGLFRLSLLDYFPKGTPKGSLILNLREVHLAALPMGEGVVAELAKYTKRDTTSDSRVAIRYACLSTYPFIRDELWQKVADSMDRAGLKC